jgi:secretion/DNA translocation related CpaE-like protein
VRSGRPEGPDFGTTLPGMMSSWVLLLTDDPVIAATVSGLSGSVGLPLREDAGPGHGPPGLIVLGSDRMGDETRPAIAAGVPCVLIAAGDPDEALWRAAVRLRVEQVVLLPEAEEALRARLERVAAGPQRRALVVAVVGGCGGAGASVLAGALARVSAALTRTVLIEVDRMGGGADLLLGAEDEPGLRWPDLASVRGRLMPGSLIGGLPVVDRLHVLSWDRSSRAGDLSPEAVSAVLEAARQECAVVVLDLPRRCDPVVRMAARTSDFGLLVVPAEVRAAAAARRVATDLEDHLADLRLVVRGPAPTGLRAEAVADALDLPLAGVLKPEPGLRAGLDRGEPPGVRPRGPLAVFCRELLAPELAARRDPGFVGAPR